MAHADQVDLSPRVAVAASLRRPSSALGWIPLVILLLPSAVRAQDDWLGRDKALHFGASALIAGGGYALAVPLTDDRGWRAGAGAGVGLAAGIAKELYDAAGHGDPSYRDLAWDAVGVVVGVGFAYLVDQLVASDGDRTPRPVSGAPTMLRLRF